MTTPGPIPLHGQRPRFELLWAALAVAALAIAYLWTPITRFADSTYSPVDFMQTLPLTRVQVGWIPGNQLISDVAVEYHPWYLFDREAVRQGKLPLWNRFNGFGVPHLANFQSAVFSPLTLCYYAFSFKLAVLLTAFTKLFGLGFFTYLFLRALRLSPIACLFGATVYAFTGHNLVRLGYSQSSVAMLVPAGLWAIERIAQTWARARESGRAHGGLLSVEHPGRMAAFVAVLVVGALLGHPETFYFGLGTLIVYALARGFALWRDHRSRPGAVRALGAIALQLFLAGVLAAAIAMIQLLPFFEYLGQSWIFDHRTGGGQTPLPIAAWPCLAFPNLLGNPSEPYFVDYNLPRPDFDTVTLAYVGSLALLLALLAPFLVRGRRVLTFFAAMGVVWVLYAYALFGTQPLFELVPTLAMVPINRSQVFVHMCVAVCSAFLVDHLVSGHAGDTRARRLLGAAAVLVAGGVFLALFRAGGLELAAETWRLRAGHPAQGLIAEGSTAHMRHMTWLLLAGVGCTALGWYAPRCSVRLACALVLVVAAYAQTGHLFARYNPITPDDMVYPRTPLMEQLKAKVAGQRHVFLGPTALPPHANSVYGIESIAVWDGINIRRFELLRQRLFGPGGNWQEVHWTTTRGLQLFGIEMLFDADGWIDVDTALGFVEEKPGESYATAPILPGSDVELDFSGFGADVSALRLCFSSLKRPQVQTFDITISDKESGEVIVSKRLEPGALDPLERDRVFTRVVFPPLRDARNRNLTLRVSSPDGVRETGWSLVARKDYAWMVNRALWRQDGFSEPPEAEWHPRSVAWQTRQDGRVLDGQIVVDLHMGLHRFRAEGTIVPYAVYTCRDAVPRFHTVSDAWLAASEQEAWNAVLRADFQPSRMVVLEDVDPALATRRPIPAGNSALENEPVEILREDNGHVRLRTTRREPGWLVLAQPWFPGWKARVNDKAVPIACANFAFQAVRLEPGPSRIELDYEPESVRLGAWISFAGLLACATWLHLSRRAVQRS